MKQKIEPHLIPMDHPIKPILDRIFEQKQVTINKQAIVDAGFSIIVSMPRSFAIVARHPLIPGYIFKIHLNSEKQGRYGTASWEWLTRRCTYAKKIREIIEKNQIQYFTVPDKWLYPLHVEKKTDQPVLLIATDMELTSAKQSVEAWKTIITPSHLKELYLVLKEHCGSSDVDSNVPYTKNGTFAFTDTEKPPKSLKKVKNHLSPRMEKYWLSLIGK